MFHADFSVMQRIPFRRLVPLTAAVFAACALSLGPVACTTETAARAATSDGGGVEEVDPSAVPDGGGKPPTKASGGQRYDGCSADAPCATALDCVVAEGGQHGVCLSKCSSAKGCAAKETCIGHCTPSCNYDDECPPTLHCGGRGGACDRLNCRVDPNVCSASQRCDGLGYCQEVPVVVACTKTATSGLATTATIGSLTSAQRGTLCDWSTCQFGGYGTSAKCDGGLGLDQPPNQAACVADLPATCAATVADVEACSKLQAANPCDLSIVLGAPACASVAACHK